MKIPGTADTKGDTLGDWVLGVVGDGTSRVDLHFSVVNLNEDSSRRVKNTSTYVAGNGAGQ